VIAKELEEVKKDFGDERRTEIVDEGVELSIEDLIADEDVAITVTNSGYIKRTPITTYSRQGRGGKGRFGAAAKNGDFVEHLFIASTHAYLMIFTDDGMVYKLKVHEVPDAAASARGKAVVNLINIPSDRRLAGVVPVREFAEGRYVAMVTRKGVIKKTSLADFQNIRTNGIIAINIDDGDQLLDVVLTDGTKRIFIATHNGLAIRFDEKNARPMGRATRGTRGIELRKDDFVVSVCAVSAEDPHAVWVGAGNGPPGNQGGLGVTRDLGESWERLPLPKVTNSTVWNLAFHPSDPRRVYASSISGEIFATRDGGRSWAQLPMEFGEVRALAWIPAGG